MKSVDVLMSVSSLIFILMFFPPAKKSSGGITDYSKLVFVLSVSNINDVQTSEMLIKSLRENGGKYSNSRIYIVYDKPAAKHIYKLSSYNVEFLPIQIDSAGSDYLFSRKVYASAQVERILNNQDVNLIWLDNECLVFSEPTELELSLNIKAAMRPVFLLNNIGQLEKNPVDGFWKRIYSELKIDPDQVPIVESLVESKRIRFYINCQVISVNPGSGIFADWERVFTKLVRDEDFQKNYCSDIKHQIFLHQAVLSAVICSKVELGNIQWFSNAYGYPIQQHKLIPPEKRIGRIGDVRILIYENFLKENPDWIEEYQIQEPLKSWLLKSFH